MTSSTVRPVKVGSIPRRVVSTSGNSGNGQLSVHIGQKKPATKAGFYKGVRQHRLLDFAFFVHDVLARDGVILFDFHFFGRVFLVFVGRVEVTGARRGIQANLISSALGHCLNPPLYLYAACPQVGQYNIDAFLVDDAQTFGRNAKLHPAVLTFHPETVAVEVGQKTPLTLDIRVRHIVSGYRSFSGDLTNS
jgi:hypothetical protein